VTVSTVYCTPEEVKAAGLDTITGANARFDVALTRVCKAVARQIDGDCKRRFYADDTVTPRVFTAAAASYCDVDDIAVNTEALPITVKIDVDGDGVYETTLPAAAWWLSPPNGITDWGEAGPYTRINLRHGWTFPRCNGEPRVQASAPWGWPAVPDSIHEASIIQTVSVFKAPAAPHGVAGSSEFGQLRIRQALHPTAADLIDRYILRPIEIG